MKKRPHTDTEIHPNRGHAFAAESDPDEEYVCPDCQLDRRIREAVEDMLERVGWENVPVLLSEPDMADWLQTSPQVIAELAREGLPFIHVGHERRFSPRAVLHWLEKNEAA